MDEDSGREGMAFLDGGLEHCYIGGGVGAEDEVVYPWDAAEGENILEDLMGVGSRWYRYAELVHCGRRSNALGLA